MFNPINNFISYSKSLHSNSAIISLKKEVSFIELSKLVKNLSNNFRKFGIKPGQIIVVCFQDKTIEWIVTLALIHEGVITVSNHGYAELPNELKPDYILVDRPASHLFPFQTILLDETWFKIDENAFDIEPQDYVSKKNLFRLALTSGTTGYPKVVPLTIEQVENRADLLLSEWKTDGSQHEIINLRLSTAPAFYRLFGTFFLKGLPYYDSSSDIETLKLIANFKVTNIFASPAQLGSLIDEIKKTGSDLLSPVNVRYAGGNLSLSLSNNIKKYLGLNITNLYGASEVGPICINSVTDLKLNSHTVIGSPLKETKIQIVDENNKTLNLGESGLVRVKTPYMIEKYYKNEKDTNTSFVDGWFYPGDTGYLDNNGNLILTGRSNEVVNIDGVKTDPNKVDQIMQNYKDIKDAASFSFVNDEGETIFSTLLVTSDKFTLNEFKNYLLNHMDKLRIPKFFLQVNKIDRNEMGKISRDSLGKDYKSLLNDEKYNQNLIDARI